MPIPMVVLESPRRHGWSRLEILATTHSRRGPGNSGIGTCLSPQAQETEDGGESCVPAGSELAEAVARNATTDEIELLMEHKEHSERMAAQNVAIGAAWLCGAVALVFAAGAWALRRRAPQVASQPAGYEVLVD